MTAAGSVVGPGPARSGSGVRAFLRLVMIEHSIFALPFAYIAALTAMLVDGDGSIEWGTLLIVTVAMVALRTFAMAANRIIDREIDGRNPRTAHREPVAAVPMVVYPYGKRFTTYPHAILGLAQAIGPIGAWLAVTGEWSWPAVLLGLAVGIWIGGFDLIYACQDVDTDRAQGIRSVPARFGIAGALYGARAAHVVTMALFVWYALATDAGALFWVGLAAVAGVFAYEHSIVRPDDLSRLNRAFFTLNGVIGIILFCCAAADLLVRDLSL